VVQSLKAGHVAVDRRFGRSRTKNVNAPDKCLQTLGRPTSLALAVSMILAAHAARSQDAKASDTSSSNSSLQLQEVVVTAQRREQSTMDVGYNISAISGDSLKQAGVVSVSDLAYMVPGLVVLDTGLVSPNSNNTFTIRGLSSADPSTQSSAFPTMTTNTVTTYFGETPVFFQVPMTDIERVEVLRGPQGTLYGAGAVGGAIRFIPNRPTFDSVNGSINIDGGKTYNSDGTLNGGFNTTLNLPVNEMLAVRVVGSYEHLAGFIDRNTVRFGPNGEPVARIPGDVSSGYLVDQYQYATNPSDQLMGRVSLRWKPNDWADLQVNYLHQTSRAADQQFVSPDWKGGTVDYTAGTGGADALNYIPAGAKYTTTNLVRQPYAEQIDLVSFEPSFDFGLATFAASTSYYKIQATGTLDGDYNYTNTVTGVLPATPYYKFYPRFTSPGATTNDKEAFTQELRVISKWDSPFNYILGLYYQWEYDLYNLAAYSPGIAAYGAATGSPVPNPQYGDETFDYRRGTTFDDRAAFGELYYDVTKRWQLTGGFRIFSQSFHNHTTLVQPLCGAPCSDTGDPLGTVVGDATDAVHHHLLKGSTLFKLTDNTNAYLTYSEGFRRGGGNGVPTAGFFASLPQYATYQPDYAKSYEIGIKGQPLANRIRYTLDVFQIKVTNTQINGFSGSANPIVYNGGDARSRGVEAELQARVTDPLTVSFGYAYTQAELTSAKVIKDLPFYANVLGLPPKVIYDLQPGDELPGVPKNSVTAASDYVFGFGAPHQDASLRLHLNASYRSKAAGLIDLESPLYYTIPSIFILDARVTYETGTSWSLSAYTTNITNSTGSTATIGSSVLPEVWGSQNIIRPRTIGLSAGLKY